MFAISSLWGNAWTIINWCWIEQGSQISLAVLILIFDKMCGRHLGFVLLVLFPGLLHGKNITLFHLKTLHLLNACLKWVLLFVLAQDEVQICKAPRLLDGYLVPEQESYYHDTQVSYGCDKGRKPLMDGWWATITCHNGTWSAVPQCIGKGFIIPILHVHFMSRIFWPK